MCLSDWQLIDFFSGCVCVCAYWVICDVAAVALLAGFI